MTRHIFIPSEDIPKFVRFFSLEKESIGDFQSVVESTADGTLFDTLLALMNKLGVSDDEASSLLDTYQYLVFAHTRTDDDASGLLDEVEGRLEARSDENVGVALESLRANRNEFTALLDAQTAESELAKEEFLRTGTKNSVRAINSICDLRPQFDREHNKITGQHQITHLEFTVTDSSDTIDVISVSLDDRAWKALVAEVDKVKKKWQEISDTF